MLIQLLFIVSAYLIGSIPFGYLIARLFKGIDIREFGSHNIGATNVLRVVGPFPAVLTLLFDVGKGATVVLLAKSFASFTLLPIIVGIAVICGHNFSIFLRGKGGKGIATGFGVLIGLAPLVALFTLLIWLITFGFSRYVSLSSLIASLSLPLFFWLRKFEPSLIILGVLVFILTVTRHRGNIERLIKGTEPKIKLK